MKRSDLRYRHLEGITNENKKESKEPNNVYSVQPIKFAGSLPEGELRELFSGPMLGLALAERSDAPESPDVPLNAFPTHFTLWKEKDKEAAPLYLSLFFPFALTATDDLTTLLNLKQDSYPETCNMGPEQNAQGDILLLFFSLPIYSYCEILYSMWHWHFRRIFVYSKCGTVFSLLLFGLSVLFSRSHS
mgnify:CR=1 FL=1